MTGFSSNHEEVDTKMLFCRANALSASKDSAVILCSPSEDIDINVFATALLKSRFFIEYGSGSKTRNVGLKISL